MAKKILLLGSYAPSLINFRGPLLKNFVKQGHEVFACAPEDSHEIKEILSDIGVTYYAVRLARTGINPFVDLYSLKCLTALFRRVKPDIFLGYTIKPVTYGSIAAWLAGVPEIYSMVTGLGYSFSGGSLKKNLVGWFAGRLYRFAFKWNKKVFFQNPDDLALMRNRGFLQSQRQAVLINGSGVDVNKFSPAAYPSSMSFLLVARLVRDKGVYEYAEAAHIIREKYPEIRFLLVGWIDKNPSAIKESDLQLWQESGDIVFWGRLADIRPALQDCSVYVLPSYREGTPRTVLEAMAMGRPVITTDAPGCRETVTHGINGFLVPVRDVTSLVETMEKFIQHPELVKSMGRASREIAKKKYDVREVNAVILKWMGLSSPTSE